MLYAVKRKSYKIVKLFLAMNVVSNKANHSNGSKISALSIACTAGSMELVKLLVEEGAEVNYLETNNLKHKEGENILTPLMCAARTNQSQIIQFLVEEAGADLETQDKEHRTALFWSLEGTSNVEALKMLLSLGANIHAKNKSGEIILHTAARCNRSKLAEMLLETEPDLIDSQDNDGKTPLHHAIYPPYRREEIGFSNQSIDVSNRNQRNNKEVFRVLLNFSPDLDEHGISLVYWTLRSESEE